MIEDTVNKLIAVCVFFRLQASADPIGHTSGTRTRLGISHQSESACFTMSLMTTTQNIAQNRTGPLLSTLKFRHVRASCEHTRHRLLYQRWRKLAYTPNRYEHCISCMSYGCIPHSSPTSHHISDRVWHHASFAISQMPCRLTSSLGILHNSVRRGTRHGKMHISG